MACVKWQGAKNPEGYGNVTAKEESKEAHRLAYEYAYGPIEEGMLVCHSCNNPSCVNPEHLFLGTHADSTRDKVKKRRQSRPIGECHHSAKLNWRQVHVIRSAYDFKGCTQTDLAEVFRVTRQLIYQIVNYQAWKE